MPEMFKEWVAAIDDRTTMICLDAAGQIVKAGNLFTTLSGRMDGPPAHWGCRSLVSYFTTGMTPKRQIGDANQEFERRLAEKGRDRFERELRRNTRATKPGGRKVGVRQQQRRREQFRRRRTFRDQQLRAEIETTQGIVDDAIQKHGHTMDAWLDRRFASVKGQTATTISQEAVVWKPTRQRVHKAIFDDVLRKAESVPADREAVIMGGLPGAGKTTTVRGSLDLSRFVNLNPDDFKELLLLRGYADDATQLLYDQGKISLSKAIAEVRIPGSQLKGLEAAALLHEESSWLYKEFSRRFVQSGKNVVLDVTMGSARSLQPQIEALRQSGYRINILFVDVDVSTTMSRAIARWQRSGRFVPPSYIESLADPVWGSRNRATFEEVKGLADSWTLFDNNFRPIKLAES